MVRVKQLLMMLVLMILTGCKPSTGRILQSLMFNIDYQIFGDQPWHFCHSICVVLFYQNCRLIKFYQWITIPIKKIPAILLLIMLTSCSVWYLHRLWDFPGSTFRINYGEFYFINARARKHCWGKILKNYGSFLARTTHQKYFHRQT